MVPTNRAMWLFVWLMVTGGARALATGYCSSNTFATNTTWLQFTKEPVPLEYAVVNTFKSIHCCGKGYRSIEWFKDNVSYPWSANVSNMILYPEAANQTLYTQAAADHDSGNYTCRMSNETHSEHHTVHLEIIEKAPDAPKIMYISKDKWVEDGGSLRLYCEALLGKSYLADAESDLRWRKITANGTEGDLLTTQREMRTVRDENTKILGSYLLFDSVSAPDYGAYVCVVYSNDAVTKTYVTVHYLSSVEESPTVPVSWSTVLMCVCGGAALLLTIAVLHARFTARLLLAARMAHAWARPSRSTTVHEKEFDVLVSWTLVDDALVRGALLPALNHYRYRVLTQPLSTNYQSWHSELVVEASRCRSLVCVMSPHQMTIVQLHEALRQLRALPLPPVVVLLQDLPKLKLKRCAKESQGGGGGGGGDSLVALLRRTRLVAWRGLRDSAFWAELRLALPLPSPQALQIKPNTPSDSEDCHLREEMV